jgi:hypothetical protein
MPVLTCYPVEDARFAHDASSALHTLDERATAEDLEATLQPWYPSCVVHRQAELARPGSPIRWYAFRDGHRPPRAGRDRLLRALARSRDLVAASLAAADVAAENGVLDRTRVGPGLDALHRRFDPAIRATRKP